MIENINQLNKHLIEIDIKIESNLVGKLDEVNQLSCRIIEDAALENFKNIGCRFWTCKNKKRTLKNLQQAHIQLDNTSQKIKNYMINFSSEQNCTPSKDLYEKLSQKINDLQTNSENLRKQMEVLYQKRKEEKKQIQKEKIQKMDLAFKLLLNRQDKIM